MKHELSVFGFPIKKKRPQPNQLGTVQYLCLYRVDHLHDNRHINSQEELQIYCSIFVSYKRGTSTSLKVPYGFL